MSPAYLPPNAYTHVMTLHTDGGSWPVESATFSHDRGSAPQLVANVTLENPPAAVRDAIFTTRPVLIEVEMRGYVGTTMAQASPPWQGRTLGSIRFADLAGAHVTNDAATPATEQHFVSQLTPSLGPRFDHMARTLSFDLESIEGPLSRAVCLDPAGWGPVGYQAPGSTVEFTLESIWRQVTSLVGRALPMVAGNDGLHPYYYDGSDQPPKWEFGQSAFDYLETLRQRMNCRYLVDSATGDVTFQGAGSSGWTPLSPQHADHALDYSTERTPTGGVYPWADALAYRFTWNDAAGDRREEIVVRLGAGIASWTDALAPAVVDYDGLPVPQIVERDLAMRQASRFVSRQTRQATPHGNPDGDLFWATSSYGQPANAYAYPDGTMTTTTIQTGIL